MTEAGNDTDTPRRGRRQWRVRRKHDWRKEALAAISAALPHLPIPRRTTVPPPPDNGDPAVAWFREWHH